MQGSRIASRVAMLTLLVAIASGTSSAMAAAIDSHVAPGSATQVPEPSVIILVALGAVAIVARQIRRLRRTRTARLH